MEFLGEYKITEFGDKTRFITIKGESKDDRGLSFVCDNGEAVFVGDLKYIANNEGIWRVTNSHEIVECSKEEIAFLYQSSLGGSPMTASFINALWRSELDRTVEEYVGSLKRMTEHRDIADEKVKELRELLKDANGTIDERNKRVAELEKEIVELKKPKKSAKKAEETTDESERLPSESEEK